MSEVVLNAEVRTALGKRAKHVRSTKKVPGVFYSAGEKNLNIEVSEASLAPLVFTSKMSIIDLRVDDTSRKCVLRDVQFDAISDLPIHFDLQGIKESEKLTVDVPVVLIGGTPKGIREGGLLQHILHKLSVSCLPRHIPEKIEVNVAELEMNRSVHIRDISISDVTILGNPDASIVAVLPPLVVKETPVEAVAEETPQEPEVLAKGKKAEEGEEGEAETPKKEGK
jgi:large subunit ribosomal protein L25